MLVTRLSSVDAGVPRSSLSAMDHTTPTTKRWETTLVPSSSPKIKPTVVVPLRSANLYPFVIYYVCVVLYQCNRYVIMNDGCVLCLAVRIFKQHAVILFRFRLTGFFFFFLRGKDI